MVKFEHVLNILKTHKSELPYATDGEKDEYVNQIADEIDKLVQRDKEDLRLATEIAVDTSKMFITIAIAVFVAIGGFIQFAYKDGWGSCPVIFLFIAEGLTFLSMLSGFFVISRAYKRGEGRLKPKEPPWSTEDLKHPINLQAWLGVFAMVTFAIAVVLYNPGDLRLSKKLVITLPNKVAKTISAIDTVDVSGQWSKMSIQQQNKFTLQLDPVPANEVRSFTLEFK